jgi:hypothetical protein
VWVLPSGAAFAVGDNSRALRFDGSVWNEYDVDGAGNTLRSVWGSGPSRVYVAGSGPVLQRYDGTSWSDAALPASTGTRDLVDVSGSGVDSAIAVGSRLLPDTSVEALVERTTDGGLTWTQTSIPGTTPPCCSSHPSRGLAGVSTPDGAHVFAVGSDAVGGAMIMRSSDGGATWTAAFFPANGRVLNDVWAMDADTVVVVGQQAGAAGGVDGVILRSTNGGATWTTTTWPGARSDALEDQPLLDVWGAGAALYTVGWQLGTSGYYESVIMSSPNGGGTWSQKVVSTPGASLQLVGITASAAGDVYAVGKGGLLFHYDGTTVLQMLSGTEADLNAAAAVATNNVYVVGTQGVRLHGLR